MRTIFDKMYPGLGLKSKLWSLLIMAVGGSVDAVAMIACIIFGDPILAVLFGIAAAYCWASVWYMMRKLSTYAEQYDEWERLDRCERP